MAFPANQALLQSALQEVQRLAAYIKGVCTQNSALMAAGTVDANIVFGVLDTVRLTIQRMDAQIIPGLQTYAQSQYNNAGLDITTEYNNMRAALVNVINWIVANFPKDTGNFAQAYTLAADGTRTPAQ